MKKLYTKLAGSDLKFSRFSFVKVLSLATAATFLSNVTPVFSANPDFRNTFLEGVNSAGVSYPQSIISVAGLNASSVSKDNYLTVLNQVGLEKINAANDYANFLTKTLSDVSDYSPVVNVLMADSKNVLARTLDAGGQYKKSLVSPRSFVVDSSLDQQLVQDDENTDIINVSNILRSGSTEGMQRDVSGNNVIFGEDVDAKTVDSVVIGYKAKAVLAEGDKKLAASVIIGSKSEIHRGGSVAVGADIVALKNDAVAVGRFVRVEEENGTALGFKTQVKVVGGVALGSNSVAKRAAGVSGYTPMLQGPAKNTSSYWKSTLGAVSVGDVDGGKTRQITGVAAGSEDADAVNVIQLKDLERVVRQNGWKLSVDGKNAKTVIMDSGVDFSTGSTNLNITKGDKDNNVKFDLAQDVVLTSLKAGTSTLDATGLVITDGPKITTGGIGAGNKRVTGIAPGDLSADSQDAVNGSQLNVVATHIAGYLGGGVKFTNGQWDDPKFKIKAFNPETNEIEEESFPDVAKAFEGLGKSYVNLHNEIKKAADDSVFKWNAESKSITIAAGEEESGQGSIAIGIGSKTKGDAGIALGKLSNASAENSIALGGFAAASAENSIALGSNAQVQADVTGGVAVGYKSVSRNSAFTVGYDPSIGSQSTNDNVIWKSTQGAFSIGDTPNKITRQLTGVAAGTNDTDAVNIAQLKKLREFVAQGWTLSLNDKAVSGFQPGDILNFVSGSKNFEIKNIDKRDSNDKKITFDLAQDVTLNSVKLKDVTLDKTGLTIENGPKVIADGIDAVGKKITGVAAGSIISASSDAINGDQLHTITEDLSKILGGDVSFDGKNFKVPEYKLSNIDEKGEVTDKPHTDVGSAFKGLDDNIKNVNDRIKEVSQGVAKDSLSWSKDEDAFVATHGEGEKKGNSKITSLKDGDVAANSTDAVNGSQLYSTNSSLAEYFGGGTKYEDGKWTKPDFKVAQFDADGTEGDKKTYHNVADAFEGVNKTFTTLNDEIVDVRDSILVKQEEEVTLSRSLRAGGSGVITIGKAAGGTEVSILNNENATRKLSGVSAGTLSESSTDAVNGSQLFTTNKNVTKVAEHTAKYFGGGAKYESEAWTDPSFKVKIVKEDGSDVEEQSYASVAEAFEGVGNSFQNIHKEITQSNTAVTENIKQNALMWSEKERAFVALHGEENSKSNSKIKYLANGDITVDSSDAVNGSQLYSMNKMFAEYFGGGAGYNENGEWIAPTFKVKTVKEDGKDEEKSYDNVADALAGVGTSFTNIHNEINKEINKVVGDSLVKQDEKTHVISIGGEKGGTSINIANSDNAARTLSGVKEGDVSKVSTDAVNGSQLYSMNKMFATYFGGGAGYDDDGEWSVPSFKLKTVNSDGKDEEKSYGNVADALAGVGTSFTNIHKEINKVVGDSLVKQDEKTHVISIGGEKGGTSINIANSDNAARTLSGVKEGDVSKVSTDAVNGSQLYSMNKMFATYFGGGAGYDDDGKWSVPSFKLKTVNSDGKDEEKSYGNVADALAGVGTSFTNIHKEINKVVGDSLVKQDEKTHVISIGGEKSGTSITLSNIDGAERTLSGVRGGAISETSTDAVNGSQLYSMS
uniref:hypothetical protein n=1 Tax=Bartonella sp. MM55XZML TaxID=3243552 RepID=UPI0035CFFF8A